MCKIMKKTVKWNFSNLKISIFFNLSKVLSHIVLKFSKKTKQKTVLSHLKFHTWKLIFIQITQGRLTLQRIQNYLLNQKITENCAISAGKNSLRLHRQRSTTRQKTRTLEVPPVVPYKALGK